MNTFTQILILIFLNTIILSAQHDSTDLLVGSWYANGYGKDEIAVQDTVQFTKVKIECNTADCDFKEWIFKGNGDFENMNYFAKTVNSPEHVRYFGTKSKNLKWGVLKRQGELIISGENSGKAFKILSISASKLVVKRLK